MTRDYLRFLRHEIALAVDEMLDFDEAYARVDWSRFRTMPAFDAVNRRNAFNTFVLMEREALQRKWGSVFSAGYCAALACLQFPGSLSDSGATTQ